MRETSLDPTPIVRLKPMFKAVDKHVSIQVNDLNRLDELQKTFVLVGVERGGTSMVAGVLRALGVHLGDETGRNHEDHNFQNDDENLLLQYIEVNNSAHDVWGFKVPKASLKLDFYNKALRNPYYIVVFRNISSVVDSWCSRGPVDPCQTALHAIHYYQKAIESVQLSGRPALFISYERACENIDEMIHDLNGFCRLFPSERMIIEAKSMVTGDGGGYVNLSDRHFHVKELGASVLGRKEILLHPQEEPSTQPDSIRNMIDYDVIQPVVNPLPKVIYLIFQLVVSDKKILEGNKIRLFMNYDDHFFIGHAYCPVLREGKNVLKIEHYGGIKGFAFSGVEDGMIFSIVGSQLFTSTNDLDLKKSWIKRIFG